MSSQIILVIDDNKDTVWLYKELEKLLLSQHLKMPLATNGIKALAFLKSQKPNIILLRYPSFRHGEVISYIQSQAKLRYVPLVIVSGLPKIDDRDDIAGVIGRSVVYHLPGIGLELKNAAKRAIALTKERYLQDSKHSIFPEYSQTDIKPEHLKLQELLANKKWREADLETTKLIFKIDLKQLSVENISVRRAISAKFDAMLLEDLQTINYLWVIHSNGHFGFSVQWEILQQIKAEFFEKYPVTGLWTPETALAIALGWLSKGAPDGKFDCETRYFLDTAKGHLPTVGKQELGTSFHHGFVIHYVFNKLYPR